MPIRAVEICTRCHREHDVDTKNSAQADEVSARPDVRAANAQKILDFVNTIPLKDLPAAFAFTVGAPEEAKEGSEELEVIHVSQAVLCAPKSDNARSRSCAKIASGLLSDLVTLEKQERKPRAKSEEKKDGEAASTEAKADETKPAEGAAPASA